MSESNKTESSFWRRVLSFKRGSASLSDVVKDTRPYSEIQDAIAYAHHVWMEDDIKSPEKKRVVAIERARGILGFLRKVDKPEFYTELPLVTHLRALEALTVLVPNPTSSPEEYTKFMDTTDGSTDHIRIVSYLGGIYHSGIVQEFLRSQKRRVDDRNIRGYLANGMSLGYLDRAWEFVIVDANNRNSTQST